MEISICNTVFRMLEATLMVFKVLDTFNDEYEIFDSCGRISL